MLQQQSKDGDGYATWRDVVVHKKVTVFSLRILKRDMQQLKYIASLTGLSLNALCLTGIQTHNRNILKEVDEFN